jgi:hypothetical protein
VLPVGREGNTALDQRAQVATSVLDLAPGQLAVAVGVQIEQRISVAQLKTVDRRTVPSSDGCSVR